VISPALTRRLTLLGARLVVLAGAIAGWQIGTESAKSPYFLPPSAIIAFMYHRWFSGSAGHLWLTADAIGNLLPSLGRLLAGWFVAALAGVVLGVAIGRSSLLADLAEPLVHFGRAVPPSTLVPVFLFVFKIGTPMEVASIIFGVIWPVLLNSIDGARHMHPGYVESARAFRIPFARRLFRIILPGAAPKILAGLRLSLAIALVLMVVSEFVGSTNGIGNEMQTAQSGFDIPLMWSVIGLLGLLGVLFNALFRLAERRILAWQPATDGE
jgi:ABC-type nitrate/sulfonate/bicarbonate transport system permease component